MVFYLDPQKAWSRRVFNGRGEGQRLVLLLKDEHYRLVKPIGQGFPLEWNKNLGGSFSVQGGGAKSVEGNPKLLGPPFVLAPSNQKQFAPVPLPLHFEFRYLLPQ